MLIVIILSPACCRIKLEMIRIRKIIKKQRAKPNKKTVKIKNRQQTVKARRNFFPTLLVTIFLWISVTYLVYFVDPYSFAAIQIFFFDIFVTLLFTFSLILANTRRGLETAILITVFLILRYFGIGNIVNLLLMTALVATIEYYLSAR